MKYSTEIERAFKDIMTTEYTVPDDHKGVNNRGMQDLCGLITGNFRAEKIDVEKRQILQLLADTCTKKKEPVTFTMPIGGYKNWHISSAPEAGWAEFFNVSFMKDLALKIAAYHKYGVEIVYQDSDIVNYNIKFSNYPAEYFELYRLSLEKILDFFNKKFNGKNIVFKLERLKDVMPGDIFSDVLQKNTKIVKELWKDKKYSDKVLDLETKSRKNYYGGYIPGTEEAIRISAQEVWAFHKTFFEMNCVDRTKRIPVIFRKGLPIYLYLRSNYNSLIQFWIGEGVIIDKGDKMYPMILSVNGLKKNRLECEYPMDRFAFLGKNFKYINIMSLV